MNERTKHSSPCFVTNIESPINVKQQQTKNTYIKYITTGTVIGNIHVLWPCVHWLGHYITSMAGESYPACEDIFYLNININMHLALFVQLKGLFEGYFEYNFATQVFSWNLHLKKIVL